MKSRRICICIAGWHFEKEFYSQLKKSEVDIFIISHRLRTETPPFIFDCFSEGNCFYEPNLGYDWGCYEQFRRKGLWQRYETVFFMHDDLQILSLDFIPHTQELLSKSAKIVGNGINSAHQAWARTHLECYAHSDWIPPTLIFEHGTVRGSFFATSADVLRRIRKFEIFWDPKHINLRFGNYSLISNCGKFQLMFGDQCFAYLSSRYRESKYLIEEERGGYGSRFHNSIIQRLITKLYNSLGRRYVRFRIISPNKSHLPLKVKLIERWLWTINGQQGDGLEWKI